jgi:hypothetical protein
MTAELLGRLPDGRTKAQAIEYWLGVMIDSGLVTKPEETSIMKRLTDKIVREEVSNSKRRNHP